MKDKFFPDSNILLYLIREFQDKKEIAITLLEKSPVISIQVINENINVCHKKFKLPDDTMKTHIEVLFERCHVSQIHKETIEDAISVMVKYKFSYYDSLIIASALETKCKVLYSEDMQHKQNIEIAGKNGIRKLTFINPFL
ncbi:MAG: hypothetical protein A2275_08225 [Bacteroidetes bacterium RIFOXYA12_FULL_35_11]|nr:MAG: hypothetical protein A2X01_09245 [Bacteroidetes bacterium GWF2_35_48]OFY72517.1 MAG: hypothetical protein A2275_08225 [Bacteroidetes bacterium RIFOXYA12_FULL_35_11]OFY96895.1 MAG: hypothetical protein A2309_04820 [Bacteroidetes bacterium RIFOXYB2_FULL_35_7]OFZ03143.1 MAG: hypothetical protein A2491_20300 [Bacteroidetes bacterium RIFOXYC12_FULL_35_7]